MTLLICLTAYFTALAVFLAWWKRIGDLNAQYDGRE